MGTGKDGSGSHRLLIAQAFHVAVAALKQCSSDAPNTYWTVCRLQQTGADCGTRGRFPAVTTRPSSLDVTSRLCATP